MSARSALALTLSLVLLGGPLGGAAYAKPKTVGKSKRFEMVLQGAVDLSDGVAEISAFDPDSQRLFMVDGSAILKVVDLSDPSNPVELPGEAIDVDADLFAHTGIPAAEANSIAIRNGHMAVAVAADPATDNGFVAFYDTDGTYLYNCRVGALPDMLTFAPNGTALLVANEGEPSETADPEGSISIIDMQSVLRRRNCDSARDVHTADFRAFNPARAALIDKGVRLFPGKSVAEDLEPEYIAVSADSRYAWATLQEANSLALVDIPAAEIVDILPLGLKNHRRPDMGLDASDEDGRIRIRRWPVYGMYMPDAIARFGRDYLITANEGDDRGEDERIGDIELDPAVFRNPARLQKEKNLGRLGISSIDGDPDGDGEYEWLQSYGARSFTIWDGMGKKVFDSGDFIARLTARKAPDLFNADNGDPEEFDSRSDNKGAEPEGVVVGRYKGRTLAFVGLERGPGGAIGLDVTNPNKPRWFDYVRRDNDVSPEGMLFISDTESPTGKPLLVLSHEVGGTVTVYEIAERK